MTDSKADISGKELRNVIFLSMSFFAVFAAYLSIQNLQSSLNEEEGLGVISLSSLYGCIIVSGVIAPTFISWVGIKGSFIVAWVCHLIYTSANFYPSFETLIPASVLLGLISAILWTCQSTYISACSYSLAKNSEQSAYAVLSRLNGIFFTVFEATQIVGNLISSIVLEQGEYNATVDGNKTSDCGPNGCPITANSTEIEEPDKTVVYTLLGVYLGCDVIGLLITTLFLQPIPKSEWCSENNIKSSLSSCFVVLCETELVFLVPWIMFMAVEQGILWTDYTKSYISCPLGIHMVGYVMASYGTATASSALIFSRLAKYTGRYILFGFASSINMGVFIYLYMWTPSHENEFRIFFIPVIWGVSEGIWQTQSNSLIALMFPEKKEPAFANYHTWKAVGFTATFVLSTFVCVSVKLLMAISLLSLSVILYTGVEIHLYRKNRPLKSKAMEQPGG